MRAKFLAKLKRVRVKGVETYILCMVLGVGNLQRGKKTHTTRNASEFLLRVWNFKYKILKPPPLDTNPLGVSIKYTFRILLLFIALKMTVFDIFISVLLNA